MPANAALYLPVDDVELTDVIPNATRTGGFLWRATAFQVPIKGGTVQFNVMPKAEVPQHLAQFSAYVESLDEDDASRQAATQAIAATGSVLGLETQLEFEGNDEIGELLESINDHYKGFIFMFDSLVLHGNEVLVGPLKAAAT
ncbi:MAG TPA: hypothetical protein VK624_05845 [Steroidobacteraceae bacterium]|nr:hypothetical protein [Steroidobacteraceae bacterium]